MRLKQIIWQWSSFPRRWESSLAPHPDEAQAKHLAMAVIPTKVGIQSGRPWIPTYVGMTQRMRCYPDTGGNPVWPPHPDEAQAKHLAMAVIPTKVGIQSGRPWIPTYVGMTQRMRCYPDTGGNPVWPPHPDEAQAKHLAMAVIPTKVGIQSGRPWIPTYVGMTQRMRRYPDTGGNSVWPHTLIKLKQSIWQWPSFPRRWESSLAPHLDEAQANHLAMAVIPTKVGIQSGRPWIPTCVGMTQRMRRYPDTCQNPVWPALDSHLRGNDPAYASLPGYVSESGLAGPGFPPSWE
jgi:hypothetical protein